MSEMNQLKVFTVKEANEMIPALSAKLVALQENQQTILTKEVEIDALELLYPSGDDDHPASEVASEIEKYNELVDQFYALIDEIHGMGCFLKDIEMGLVDFYSIYQGRVVYLCWKRGETEVGFWHEVGSGYAYRQPILQEGEKESSG